MTVPTDSHPRSAWCRLRQHQAFSHFGRTIWRHRPIPM